MPWTDGETCVPLLQTDLLARDRGCLETKEDARMEADASNDAALERV